MATPGNIALFEPKGLLQIMQSPLGKTSEQERRTPHDQVCQIQSTRVQTSNTGRITFISQTLHRLMMQRTKVTLHGATKKERRTAIACTACRQSKIKCSGNEPCSNCQRRSVDCRFSEENNKVLVSERYLRNLQNQALQWQRTARLKRSHEVAFSFDSDTEEQHDGNLGLVAEPLVSEPRDLAGSPTTTLPCNIWTSPFTLPTTLIQESRHEQRNWIWLSAFSPWSLTARLVTMMTKTLDTNANREGPKFYLDGDLYPFERKHIATLDPLDTSDLPTTDYVLHLFRIVQFRLSQAYRFFDDDTFVDQVHQFYRRRSQGKPVQSRFWFARFLMVIALGNAFLSRPRNHKDPPGAKYLARALAAIPCYTSTGKDSLLAIEALALIGVYLYSIDHREAAHLHVGHAIRISQMEGMHTQLPEEDLGTATVAQCQNLWWSLYTLDRHFSPSLGLPMTTKDSDISTLMNTCPKSTRELTFNLQLKITRMRSFIIEAIYATEKTHLGEFLEVTRNVLQTMAKYAEEIQRTIQKCFNGSLDNVPEEMRHTILLYHQCVIISTRPLLLSVLKERLEKLGREAENWEKFLALPKSLISVGIKSAEKVLEILSNENGLLETFLPFDLELTYESAILLTMAHTLFYSSMMRRPFSESAHSIFDELILCGNRIATARKEELIQIEGLFDELATRIKREGLRTLTLPDLKTQDMSSIKDSSGGISSSTMASVTGAGDIQSNWSPSQDAPAFSEGLPSSIDATSLADIGVSPEEFLAIVNQIDNPDTSFETLSEGLRWLDGNIHG